jgi:hypothetical protein
MEHLRRAIGDPPLLVGSSDACKGLEITLFNLHFNKCNKKSEPQAFANKVVYKRRLQLF